MKSKYKRIIYYGNPIIEKRIKKILPDQKISEYKRMWVEKGLLDYIKNK